MVLLQEAIEKAWGGGGGGEGRRMCVGNCRGARAIASLYKPRAMPTWIPISATVNYLIQALKLTIFAKALINVQYSIWVLIHQTASLTEMKTPHMYHHEAQNFSV